MYRAAKGHTLLQHNVTRTCETVPKCLKSAGTWHWNVHWKTAVNEPLCVQMHWCSLKWHCLVETRHICLPFAVMHC